MNNILLNFNSKECCGCGSCVNTCPTGAVSIDKDEFGFVIPVVNESICVACGKCIRACPYNAQNDQKTDSSSVTFAAVNLEKASVKNSSSGGIFCALAKYVFEKNGIVFGAMMDESFKVTHSYVDNICDLSKLQKSKYVQSSLGNAYLEVLSFLKENRYVMFSGTPCQIAGLKSFLPRKDYENLLLVEVVCHGVPNQDFFDDYRMFLESKVGKIKKYVFRYKQKVKNGMKWFSSFETEKRRYVFNWPEDSFNYFYMKGLVYRDSCYSCKFAQKKRNADITLCDYWHWEGLHRSDFDENSSVSGIVVNTKKGLDCFKSVSKNLSVVQSNFEYLALHNSALVRPCGLNEGRISVLQKWKKEGYAALDADFKRTHWHQILKYFIIRHMPDKLFNFLHKVRREH